ncbi:MAG: MFS transporter [Alphaproteobacteria bacterium]|nr:MAG: MFS transporter [Alphaproteobacteria bacterium]
MNLSPPPPVVGAPHYARRWQALIVLLAGGFMNIIDISVVNVALPPLQAAFEATGSQIEWVAAAYVLAFALGLLPLGRLGDRVGRKRMFLIGIAAFTVFSAMCGLATSIGMLIVARVLQGLSAAMITPQVMATVQVIFPPAERIRAFSYFGLTAGLASITGPLVGGLLIGADLAGLGWRWIFLINIPVGILVIAAGRAVLPDIAGHAGVRNDWAGIGLAALAVFCLIFPLVEGHSLGWPAWAFAMMAGALPAAALFVVHERRRGRAGRSQLMPLELLGDPNFGLGAIMLMLIFAGSMGGFLPITLFLQQGFDFTPLAAGLTTAPFAVGVLAGSQLLRLFGDGWPRARVAIGAACYCAGMLVLAVIVSAVGDAVSPLAFIGPLFAAGIGMNFCIASIMRTALAHVPPRDAGSGSGLLQTFQNLGTAFGIAIAGQIFFSTLATLMAAGSARHPAYVAALEAAFIFNISAFAVVALLALMIRPPVGGGRPHGQADAQSAPVPAEA